MMNSCGKKSQIELPSPRSSILNPMSEANFQSVLSNITNTPASCSNYMQTNIICLTYKNKVTVSPSVQPTSQSVNQKKHAKKPLKQIRDVAIDLCTRLNPQVYQGTYQKNFLYNSMLCIINIYYI